MEARGNSLAKDKSRFLGRRNDSRYAASRVFSLPESAVTNCALIDLGRGRDWLRYPNGRPLRLTSMTAIHQGAGYPENHETRFPCLSPNPLNCAVAGLVWVYFGQMGQMDSLQRSLGAARARISLKNYGQQLARTEFPGLR